MRKSLYIGYKGRLEAYIYIWFSKKNALVYVGERNNINSVTGRANQHIMRDSGTLYSRLYNKGYNLDDIDDFVLLSYPLPREKRFLSEETSYRITVEYLVQSRLIECRKDCDVPYKLISNVVPGSHTNLLKMKKIANEIAMDFLCIYNEEQKKIE